MGTAHARQFRAMPKSLFTTLRLLSPRDPLRWAPVGFPLVLFFGKTAPERRNHGG